MKTAGTETAVRRPWRRSPGRQRGGILIAAGSALFVSLLLLGSADVGYFFYLKRDLQRAADMAALAGAQWIESDGGACSRAITAARDNAQHNLKERGLTLGGSPEPVCGRWDPNTNTLVSVLPSLDTAGGSGGEKYFGAPAKDQAYNAIQVSLKESIPSLIPLFGSREVFAEAIAVRQEPVAAFSVGARLLSLQEGSPLHRLLEAVGLDANQIHALSASGLANVNITPSGLLQALGLPPTAILDVGTANEVAALRNLTLGGLLNATVTALSRQSGVDVQVQALQALQAQLGLLGASNPLDLPIKLFGDGSNGGVFAHLTAPGKLAALEADVNVLNVVSTSLALANKNHFLEISSLELPAGPLKGLLQAKLRVIEPPSIAIGGVGTTAYSAQTRLFARVKTDGPLLGLLGTLGIHIDLPLIVEGVTSQGELVGLCSASLDKEQAVIDVHSAVGRVCIGGFPGMDNPETSTVFSSSASCSSWVQNHEVLRLPLLAPVMSAPLTSHLEQILGSSVQRETLSAPEQRVITPSDNIRLNDLGFQVAGLVGNGVVDQLLGGGGNSGLLGGVRTDSKRDQVAKELLGTRSSGGKALSEVQWELRTSAEALRNFANKWTSGYILSGLLSLVDGLLGTVGALLGDVVCGVAWIGGPTAAYDCKVPLVKGMLAGDSVVTAVLSVLMVALEPFLVWLSEILQSLVNNVLGLGIGETDLTLYSVNCGHSRLVY